ncbi:hypothetical protein [Chryseobacterium gambrini]|uniref:hypothetical protein n=1 Tax=Chryseobacterium gambrini TaxID=373672 RepID=UPI0025B43D56|nr:hypothetical protein [Chryseobacterium gambrini]MDN4029813.1 hypothetical protein [Chryseobacterium gambrini]
MKILGIILISYLFGIITQRIITYYNYKRENAKSLKDLNDLQERLKANIRKVEESTFDGIITLITGEKIESEFFHRLSDDVFIDRRNKTEFIRDKIVSIKYIEDRRKQ